MPIEENIMIDSKLLTLIAVSETGSFSKAAKKLDLTQPAVSTHIKLLEKELKIKIFLRGNNQLKLTNEGIIALNYAKRIQSMYMELDTKINDCKAETLTLIIGITHTAESSTVMEALAKYANDTPKIHITFITGSIKELYEQLSSYAIDLAIVEGRNQNNAFNALLLDTDSLLLAVSPENHLAKKGMVTLDELRKEKMILRLPNSGTRQLFESSIKSQGLKLTDFDVNIESDSLFTIKDLVIKNIGVSVLGRSTCLEEEKKHTIVLLPIVGLSMIREVNIVYPKDFAHPEVLTSIISTYKAAMRKI
jgi:DNA-binding transcriptional LysR family regulator